ncbi:hypothetical protein F5X99DRAFT_62370 [Biscogniauxia marginata]|nr:hypothetical protein F5X99DRAFT_62370 [Biscogniauxia marginata]
MATAPIRAPFRQRIGAPRVGRSSRTCRRYQSSSSSSATTSSSSPSPSVSPASLKNPNPNPNPNSNSNIATERRPQAKAAKTGRGGAADPIAIPVPNAVAPLPFWQRLGPLTRAGQAYARAQRARPWTTQLASSLFIYLCADISAQRLSAGGGSEEGHDPARTARTLVIGGAAAIPGYCWFNFLSRSFNFASSRALSIGTKVVVNQLCFTPVFNSYFFGAQALLSGDTPREAWERVCRTVPVSFVNSFKLWPAVTAVSFAFVPQEYRSVFAGIVAVGWQTYLSYLNRQAEMVAHSSSQRLCHNTREGNGINETAAVLIRQTPVNTAGATGRNMVV